MEFDLVIRNGTIIDGTGFPRFRSDIGVVNGRLATIGRIRSRGHTEIDADGKFVTPGFIDGHTHLDAQINWDPLGSNVCWHGVTTALMGNCGFTLAPGRSDQADLVFRNIEQAEEIPRETMLAGIKWSWETFPEYLNYLDGIPKGINYGSYIGHSALRTYVMGERAFEETASESDLAAMRRELEGALRAGAIGLTTSRSSTHRTMEGKPVASRLAGWDEVRSLVDVMTDLGTGLFELDNEKHDPGTGRDEYFARLRELVVRSGRPTMFMLVIQPSDPDAWKERLRFVDEVALSGGRIFPQVNSHELYNTVGFRTGLPFDNLPIWNEFRRLPHAEQFRRLHDPATRKGLIDVANGAGILPSDLPSQDYRLVAASRPLNFDEIYVLDNAIGPYSTVAEVAKGRATTPADLMVDLSLESDFNQLFGRVLLNFKLDDVLTIMRHPRTVLGVSDAGAHVTKLADSSIPTQLLAYWVRQEEAFTWEEAIQMLTGRPASIYGLIDRGYIREGLAADLVVFDPQTVGPELPTVSNDFPANATHLKQGARGIVNTIVNGEILLEEGVHTGAHPGKLLRGALAASSGPGS